MPFFYHDQQTLLCTIFLLKTKLMPWQHLFEVIWDLGKDTLLIYFDIFKRMLTGLSAVFKFDGNTDDAM